MRAGIAAFFLFLFLNSNLALCSNNVGEVPRVESSILYAPKGWKTHYEKAFWDLTTKQQMQVRIHGLRGAALHPAVWCARKLDRTDNRRLVPIRPFFLRASEVESFRLKRIEIRGYFKQASKSDMQEIPEHVDPVLEIGFGGAYASGRRGEQPLVDKAYGLRVSAFPDLPSGFLYRSRDTQVLLQEADSKIVPSGEEFRLVFLLGEKFVEAELNGKPWVELEAVGANRGLVSLIASWHPVVITELSVEGAYRLANEWKNYQASGLVLIPPKKESSE